jgi:hypothetical protein
MRLIFLAVAAMAVAGAAFAGDDPMAERYGNTTIITNTDGTQIRYYYSPDHTFTVIVGVWLSEGTWAINGEKLCRTYKVAPIGVLNPECVPADKRHVGDSWNRPLGGTGTLVKGIQ